MAVSKWIEIICDDCGKGTGDLMPAGATEARKSAREDGWSCRGKRDRCPACVRKHDPVNPTE